MKAQESKGLKQRIGSFEERGGIKKRPERQEQSPVWNTPRALVEDVDQEQVQKEKVEVWL